MIRKTLLKYSVLFITAVALGACGGGGSDGSFTEDDGTNGTVGGGNGGGTPTTPDQQTTLRMGFIDGGGTFNNGQINTTATNLQAGQSATLTIDIIDQTGMRFTAESVSITFSSPCINQGIAEVDPDVATTNAGNATTTYTARGCNGADTITATANANNQTLTATVTIQTQPAPLGSIQFESANPTIIGIQGTGLQETSQVSFLVLDNQGNPIINQDVTFTLDTTAGGVSHAPTQDTSDSNGRVQTTVSSGTVATTVRVIATVNGTSESTQSIGLAITTGQPDQDSFTVGFECPNIEGDDFFGITEEVTALAADRFNNPVPDNTAITFQVNGGAVQGSCNTTGGGCSVTFNSQNPRNPTHRYTLLAFTGGEESFTDSMPSNGRFDDPEFNPMNDLTEAFRDDNRDGFRDMNEPFVDFDSDGMFDPPDNQYTGLLCNGPNLCTAATSLNVFRNVEFIMSDSTPAGNVTINPATINLTTGGGPVLIEVTVGDSAGVPFTEGTTISATTSQGALDPPTSFTQACAIGGPTIYEFFINPGNAAGNGTFRVTVESPLGSPLIISAPVNQT